VNTELQIKVSQWRAKAVAGTLTKEEMIEAARALREGRIGAAAASAGATTKRASAAKAAVIPNGDDLLSEMLG
jgi:hypothetical protein